MGCWLRFRALKTLCRKYLEHQMLGWWDNCSINPVTQRIILKIVGFLMQVVWRQFSVQPLLIIGIFEYIIMITLTLVLFFYMYSKFQQSSIWYAGSLGRWDQWLTNQASDVSSNIFLKFFCKNRFNSFFLNIFYHK